MKVHNTRSPEQWKILNAVVDDWHQKQVIDLGCGYGDILLMAYDNGADVVGVDIDTTNVYPELHESDRAIFFNKTIENFMKYWDDAPGSFVFDVAICFSVLPYLVSKAPVLEWMVDNAEVSFIEWQYVGDGPGDIWDDDQAMRMLSKYWTDVTPIGKTHVEGRDTYRTIWQCQGVVE